jgi:hypothetical protein
VTYAHNLQDLRERLNIGDSFDIGLGGRFTPQGISGHVVRWHTHKPSEPQEVARVKLTVPGVVDWRGAKDHGARVTVEYHPAKRELFSYTESTLWLGRKWVSLPDGRRKIISDKVVELLGDIDWLWLSNALQFDASAREIAQQVEVVEREQAKLEELRLADNSFEPIPFPDSHNDVAKPV